MTSRGDGDGPRPKKQKTSGFKWKEKKADDGVDDRDRPATGLHRGYRDRSPRRDSYRERSPPRDEQDDGQRHTTRRERSPRGHAEHEKPKDGHAKKAAPADDSISSSTAEKFGLPTSNSDKKDKVKKPKPAVSSEPMIIVNINDRLGTKAAIPCFASDNVKLFKAQVAARIGRQPHEIMLKRQGERPFKDNLTLEDYGVSSGVQLDLEIDTGD